MSSNLPGSFKKSYEDKWFALDALKDAVHEKDLHQRANILRNLASCTFHESIKLKHPSQATCHLLQTDLLAYERLVHRSGQDPLRNGDAAPKHLLMDGCLRLLDKFCPDGSYQKLRDKSWDVDTSSDRLRAYQLPCRGQWMGCSSNEISDAEIDEVFGGKDEDLNHSPVMPIIVKEAKISSSKVFPIFQKSKPEAAAIKQNVALKKQNFENTAPIVERSKPHNRWAAFESSQSEVDQHDERNEEPEPKLVFPTKPPLKRRFESDPTETEAQQTVPEENPFKTGREVLHQQLNIRQGHVRPAQSSESYQPSTAGPTKKSLGGRRNVQSKFVPPFLKPAEEQQKYDQPSADGDVEMVDERLKHIDPKMVELIKSEIMDTAATRVDWSDIAGLEYAKATIKEAVVWPLLRPDIFTGLRRPPRGILLFGPPGTGKTLIGKCIASQSKSTFFSISASSLTSKWIGDGEKMVRALFAVAAVHQPAVVFIDEIDSLLCQRSDTEHESSRRLKTEFLVQLDGATTADDERILIVGATNRPQELDEAARRRLVKRLYIPLPELEARTQILRNLLRKERNTVTERELNALGRSTDGFSGADMKTLCHEASMGPIRSISMDDMEHIDLNDVRPVGYADFEAALQRVRSSVSPDDLTQYLRWDRTYGSGSGVK